MYLDYEMCFTQTGASPDATSIAQAIVDDAAGLNFVDYALAGKNIGSGEPIQIGIYCTETFTTCTSIDVEVIINDAANASTATILAEQNLVLAELVAGQQWTMSLPAVSGKYASESGDRQFLGVNFVVNGSDAGAGKFIAAVTVDPQTNA